MTEINDVGVDPTQNNAGKLLKRPNHTFSFFLSLDDGQAQ